MRRIKLISAILVIAMLVPVLTSCKSGKKGSNVVKEDDPWFETTRFKLEKNLKPTDHPHPHELLLSFFWLQLHFLV